MTTCIGTHFQRRLDDIHEGAWLLLCNGCDEVTLVIGSRATDEVYHSAIDAEAALLVIAGA